MKTSIYPMLLFVALSWTSSMARDTAVDSGSLPNYANTVIPDGFNPNCLPPNFCIKMTAACYGTNLRSVSNPLDPQATVEAELLFDSSEVLAFKFPASATIPGAVGNDSLQVGDVVALATNTVSGAVFGRVGNEIQIFIPNGILASVKTDVAGKYVIDHRVKAITPKFKQVDVAPDPGPYTGQVGALSTNGATTSAWSSDGSTYKISVHFPGHNGFCGGYFSPLMLFFDKQLPAFSGKSDFPLAGVKGMHHWVEPRAPGFFLAFDKRGDKKITDADQLFGKNAEHDNGFEALRVLDTNRDGKVDVTDKGFEKLVLWQDRNGNGVSEGSEVFSLADKGVTALSLNYDAKGQTQVADRAIVRERSAFIFRSAKNGDQKGFLVDVWLMGL